MNMLKTIACVFFTSMPLCAMYRNYRSPYTTFSVKRNFSSFAAIKESFPCYFKPSFCLKESNSPLHSVRTSLRKDVLSNFLFNTKVRDAFIKGYNNHLAYRNTPQSTIDMMHEINRAIISEEDCKKIKKALNGLYCEQAHRALKEDEHLCFSLAVLTAILQHNEQVYGVESAQAMMNKLLEDVYWYEKTRAHCSAENRCENCSAQEPVNNVIEYLAQEINDGLVKLNKDCAPLRGSDEY